MHNYQTKFVEPTYILAVIKCFDACARVFLVLSARMDAETGRYAAPVSESKEVELCSTAIPQKTNCLGYKGLE